MKVVIHSSPSLANQAESAGWLKQGFKQHGITAEITADKQKSADVHIVQGPHYAFNQWLGAPGVLWLNRCFYGNSRRNLSIGWLNPDGSRDFKNKNMSAANGVLPELKPEKTGKAAVIFADYGRFLEAKHWEVDARERYLPVYLRRHPADTQAEDQLTSYTLADMWKRCAVAIGGKSTVLVDAAINGLRVESFDPLHVCQGMNDRQSWLTQLSWAQWNQEQIMNGKFWDHLC